MDSLETAQNLVRKVALLTSPEAARHMKRMKELRFAIQRSLHQTRLEIQKIHGIHGVLKLQKQSLEQGKSDAEAFKAFKVEKRISTTRLVLDRSLPHSTVCSVHSHICHNGCGLAEQPSKGTHYFSQCQAFNGDRCNSCAEHCRTHPGEASSAFGCAPEDHYHDHVRLETQFQTVEEILEDIKRKYDQASETIELSAQQIEDTQGAIALVERAIAKMKVDIQAQCDELKGLCSGFNFVKELSNLIRQLEVEASATRTIEESAVVGEFIVSLKAIVDNLTAKPMVVRAVKPPEDKRAEILATDPLQDLRILKGSKCQYAKAKYIDEKRRIRELINAKILELRVAISDLDYQRITEVERAEEKGKLEAKIRTLEKGLHQPGHKRLWANIRKVTGCAQ